MESLGPSNIVENIKAGNGLKRYGMLRNSEET
jgi:hypothetical protein